MFKKLTKELFIEKARLIHGDKYNYSETVVIKSKEKVMIICDKGHKFEQTPSNHLKGMGCGKCYFSTEILTTVEFIEKANKIHKNKYTYNNCFYSGINNVLNITCKYHGDFEQTAHDHIKNKKGCPICLISKVYPTRKTIDQFIKEANIVHKNIYDYSKSEYNGANKKLIIICKMHGEFKQTPNKHINFTNGCPRCRILEKTKTIENFIIEANLTHNNTYDYSKSNYTSNNRKLTIICKYHGEFAQRPISHLSGSGCPKCVKTISISETKWLDYLHVPMEYRTKKIIINKDKFIVDALNPTTNTIYEFYGDYWHGNPDVFDGNEINSLANKTFKQLYDRTIKRENILKIAGYKVLTIWENDWKKLLK